jgi:hypothetical protein
LVINKWELTFFPRINQHLLPVSRTNKKKRHFEHILTKGDETKNNDYKKRKQKHAVVDRAHPVGVAVGGNQITLDKRL